MKKFLGLLALLGILTTSTLPAFGQVCFRTRVTTNYMAAVDGYAPADYDGDNVADWAIKDFSGAWTIDYSSNGLAAYEQTFHGYGGQQNIPVPADYDGDGMADLSVKSNQGGQWCIDYASNGYGFWDACYWGYGGAQNRPVPADYDGDGMADLSVKSNGGTWCIDYASNGFGAWNNCYNGYGGAENIPVPADYDNDNKTDLAIWCDSGTWWGGFNIDLAFNGFGSWDRAHQNVLPVNGRPAAGDFNGDARTDFSVKDDNGVWHVLFNGQFPFVCQTSGFLFFSYQAFGGYGGSLNRPVPNPYQNPFATDFAVRAETPPVTSVAIDYASNGLGSWDFVYSP